MAADYRALLAQYGIVVTLTRFGGGSERENSVHLLLRSDRTDRAQRGVHLLSSVKHLQVLKDYLAGLRPAREGLPIHTLLNSRV